jgi:SSS family solute:Na+ symporter
MLGVGFFFMRKNKSTDDYFVGGRQMGSLHIGLSVVATDVGGGFSIGLGGLGFTLGISGSWLLFTGLLGAWISGVLLIPKIYKLKNHRKLLTFPQFLASVFDKRVALIAGIISAIGYLGFTSSQILAGAKLASSTFDGLTLKNALLIMGAIAIIYTALGGLKAVIYTDTIQWIVLLSGLIIVAIPISYKAIGGSEAIRQTLGSEFYSLANIKASQIINWMFTIIPIWFIGMTLYQRIYAAKDQKTAQKGWFIAGLFEYPVMAFVGVILGMFARVAIINDIVPGANLLNTDAEMGLPLLLKTILPIGFFGIVLSAYFSAIMSTADSCLMASSGNILTDVLNKHNSKHGLKYSQGLTFIIGILALFLALKMENVLELMLLSYSFMVSGLIVPVVVTLFSKSPNANAAFLCMLTGGLATLGLKIGNVSLPYGLDAIIAGILISTITYFTVDLIDKNSLTLKR